MTICQPRQSWVSKPRLGRTARSRSLPLPFLLRMPRTALHVCSYDKRDALAYEHHQSHRHVSPDCWQVNGSWGLVYHGPVHRLGLRCQESPPDSRLWDRPVRMSSQYCYHTNNNHLSTLGTRCSFRAQFLARHVPWLYAHTAMLLCHKCAP